MIFFRRRRRYSELIGYDASPATDSEGAVNEIAPAVLLFVEILQSNRVRTTRVAVTRDRRCICTDMDILP